MDVDVLSADIYKPNNKNIPAGRQLAVPPVPRELARAERATTCDVNGSRHDDILVF